MRTALFFDFGRLSRSRSPRPPRRLASNLNAPTDVPITLPLICGPYLMTTNVFAHEKTPFVALATTWASPNTQILQSESSFAYPRDARTTGTRLERNISVDKQQEG